MKKIEINADKDYKIQLDDGRWVGPKRSAQVFNADQKLDGIVNPVIIKALPNAELIKWKEPDPTPLSDLIQEKVDRVRSEAEADIDFNGVFIAFCDLQRLAPALTGTDAEIEALLPIETTTDFVIDTVEKVKAIKAVYTDQVMTGQNRIVKCRKAKTVEELEAI